MPNPPILIAPSILASDFGKLGEDVARISAAGADWIHCDVMDGHFVNNISFGPAIVEAASRHSSLPLDVHLMIDHPEEYIPRFSQFAASITCHVEAPHDVAKTLSDIRSAGLLAGLAISPPTPLESIRPFLGSFDLLLIMTVNPGFGGQPFLPEMLEKISLASQWRDAGGHTFHIEVDGGINSTTAAQTIEAGANVLVAGTAVFRAADAAAEIRSLRRKSP